MVSARLSEQEVPSLIPSDFNVCFDFPLIQVVIASNTVPVKWSTDRGRGIKGALSASIDTSFITEGTTDVK